MGLIAAKPMSGYELARHFERTLAHAWPARHPQIYPELAALEKQELIRVTEEGPRGRKTYAITHKGLEEVQRWLRDTSPDRPARNEATLRVFLLWLLSPDEAISFLADEIMLHEQTLAGFERTARDYEQRRRDTGVEPDDIVFSGRLALEWGLRYEREYIEWAKWARAEILARKWSWGSARQGRLEALGRRAAPST